MHVLKKWIKRRFSDISWRNKYINFILKCLDFPDWLVRQINGNSILPKFSIRVRSQGITQQFGGRRFAESGNVIAQLLKEQTELNPDSDVLEIGCGCGSATSALAVNYNLKSYRGIDIDKVIISACNQNRLFKEKKYIFDWMDVHNVVYNPAGKYQASSYKFPYSDKSVDIIFFISVFTHMLPEDISNYISEINRILRPGGQCLFSTFLMDFGHDGGIDFPYDHGFYRLHQEVLPEKAVGYMQKYFEDAFANKDMTLFRRPVIGSWRNSSKVKPETSFGQDVMIFSKNNKN